MPTNNGWVAGEGKQEEQPPEQQHAPTKKMQIRKKNNEMVVKAEGEPDTNQLQLTMMSTEKATCLYSKLVNPEMFYVTENFYKKENNTNNIKQ